MNSSSVGSSGGVPELLFQHVNIVEKTGPLRRFPLGIVRGALYPVFYQVIYTAGFPKDPLRNKLFVYIIFTLEVVQTIILTKSYFDIFGYGFGNPEAFNRIGAIWFSVPFLSGIVAFLAEVFYAMRLYILSRSYTVPISVCMLAVIQAGGAIANAIVVKDAGMFNRIPEKGFHIAASIWAGGSAVCDVVIACFMIRYLWRRRNDCTDTTQVIVNRIIRLVLETGTVTALFAITLLILTLLPNHASYYQVPAAILAKLYSNSMLALLNSRGNVCPSTDTECKAPEQAGPRLTVHRFVETFQDNGIDPPKPLEGYTSSLSDDWSVGSE